MRSAARPAAERRRSHEAATLLRRAPAALFVVDARGRCTFANERFCELTGLTPDAARGDGWLHIVHPDDRDSLFEAVRAALAAGAPIQHECRTVRPDGETRWIRGESAVVADDRGRIKGYVAMIADVTDERLMAERLEQRSRQDALTDLPNRLHLGEALQTAHAMARATGECMALLFLDLDAFKEVNDTLGHEAGDRLLVQVARRVVGSVRDTDTVARLGGDEFAVVLTQTDRADGARAVAEKIIRAIEQPFVLSGQQVAITASVGIALYPDHGAEEPDVLMRQADLAMYHAKRERLGFAFFDSGLSDHASAAGFSRLAELREAIDEGQLVLHYQPWIHAQTGRSDVAEALVRWDHPRYGLLAPAEFLPLAEQSGLIRALDLAVLEMACAQIATWRATPLLSEMRLAVNVSRASLLDEDFPASVAAALIRHRLEGPEIELEITESGAFGDPEQAAWFAERLMALNVRIAIDDFGTGYSSLVHLRRLHASTLKIDRSFVSHAVEDAGDAAIVEAAAHLGHRFGQYVVAEGVEDESTRSLVELLGADYIQGFHVSRPLPATALEAWMAANAARLEGIRLEAVS